MKIIKNLEEFIPEYQNMAISLGNFDGFHIGHRELIDELLSSPEEKKAVMTFDPHPLALIDRSVKIPLITPGESKYKMLLSQGIDYLFVMEFTEEFMKLSKEDFLKILVDKLRVTRIVVGFNYSFGYRGLGNADFLRSMQEKFDYTAVILDPVRIKNGVVSSTAVKKSILEGDFTLANAMLGRTFSVTGTVVHGKGLGKKIGLPTANLLLPEEQILPKNGVYAIHIIYDGKVYDGIANVGKNPTFGEEQIHIEAHILNFDEDIYGKEITVLFRKFIRGEQRFQGVEELVDQVRKDIASIDKI